MEQALKVIKEYGISAVMGFALLYMNNRLSIVEDRLYQCYEMRILNSYNQADKDFILPRRYYAVLPQNDIRIKNNDKNKRVG